MKDLQYFIESIENEPFKTTQEWMDKMYAEYNEKLFGNELPKNIKLKVLNASEMKSIMGSDNTLGCMGYDMSINFLTTGSVLIRRGRRWTHEYVMENDMYVGTIHGTRIKDIMDAKPHIYMNTKFDNLNQLQHEDTLIHEMIHLWVEKDGLFPKKAHGKEFKAKCNEVRKLAKEIYDKSYWLSTYADTSSNTAEETAEKQLKNKLWKLNFQMALIYIEMKSGEVRLIWSDIQSYYNVYKEMMAVIDNNDITKIVLFRHCYETAYNDYGNFSNSKKYRGYYKGAKYDKLVDWCQNTLKEDSKYYFKVMYGEQNEDKKKYVKPEMTVIGLPSNVDMSTFDVEEYLKTLYDADIEDVKGDTKNDKNFVEA